MYSRYALLAPLALLLIAGPVSAQANVEVFVDGLPAPFGVAVGPDGNVYVVEQGTGANDARVVIVTPSGDVFPFLEGLQSVIGGEGLAGTWNLYFEGTDLWITEGIGGGIMESHLLRVSTAGFTPGDPPLTRADLDVEQDVGGFLAGLGFDDSNLFNVVLGPGGDLFLVDSGANAMLRRDASTGALSVFATFDGIPNPTPIGPPFIDPVPTGAVYTGSGFLVSALTGFPFIPGFSRIYSVDLDGNVSLFRDGFSMLTGIKVDPRDGKLVVLEFTEPNEGNFVPGTGTVKKIHASTVQTLASGLNLPPALAFDAEGTLFVTSLFGQLLRIETVVDTSAPVCGAIVPEFDGPDGALSAVTSSAADPESGIASVTFSSLQNMLGFVDGAGPYAQGDTHDAGGAPSVALRGERISFASGGRLVVTVTNTAGLSSRCDPVVRGLDGATPEATALLAAYPNPVAGSQAVVVPFRLAEAADVTVVVYDVLGREVAVLAEGVLEAGSYEVAWPEAGQLPAGVYVVRLEAGAHVQTQRLTLVR